MRNQVFVSVKFNPTDWGGSRRLNGGDLKTLVNETKNTCITSYHFCVTWLNQFNMYASSAPSSPTHTALKTWKQLGETRTTVTENYLSFAALTTHIQYTYTANNGWGAMCLCDLGFSNSNSLNFNLCD